MTLENRTEQMTRYLLLELPEDEREAFESEYFEDSILFADLLELENDLIDRYVRGVISGEEVAKFEKSLTKLPERREKVENARALVRELDNRNFENAYSVKPPAGQWWAGFLGYRSVRFSFAAVIILILCGTAFWLINRRGVSNETAGLENSNVNDFVRETNRNETPPSNNDKNKVNSSFEGNRPENRVNNRTPPDTRPTPKVQRNAIVAAVLFPGGSRSGDEQANVVKITAETEKITFRLRLPAESAARFYDVKLNGLPVLNKLTPQKQNNADRFVTLTLPVDKLSENEQIITLTGDDGAEDNYPFQLRRER